ncbi:MAG TPA: phosphopyruvate hydratase [Candidatus Yanofskybacteria bacterium]|nr:phosphopyruvate hydratase [Candidatus Yanofskybacteria bacterium]
MSQKIKSISAEKILDSRGNATVSVTVEATGGSGSFSVPSGASTGTFEANEIKDIARVINNIETKISPKLVGMDVTDQENIDETLVSLDGTTNKSNLGGNATIGVSMACAKAAAKSLGQELFEYLNGLSEIKPSRSVPFLFMNLINGGKHAHSKLPFQEYHVVPQTESIEEALDMGTKIFKALREKIDKEMAPSFSNVGDEGGATVDVGQTIETDDVFIPLTLLSETIDELELKGKVRLAMDVAASSFFENGNYAIGKNLNSQELYEIYKEMLSKYDIMSIEDPFSEDEFNMFSQILKENNGLYIVGDDLTVTNTKRLEMAIAAKSINAIIIKPNQIGTLTETLNTMKLARDNDIECIVSHRSGETEDDFIADLAYAFRCFGLKSGAPNRGERVAKYNRLQHITSLK